jgi:predicted hotdog family 3-hydroxylacyl-ACP dehydratase
MMIDPADDRPKLPHAGKMHWLDRAELAADGTIRAWRTIGEGHPFTVDGVLLSSALIELIAQAAAAGAIEKASFSDRRLRRGVLAAIAEAQVFGAVAVGDTVLVSGAEDRSFAGFISGTFEARIGDALVARARMTFHLMFE